MTDSDPKRATLDEALILFEEYAKHATTRRGIFKRVSQMTGIPVNTLRVAAMRRGLTKKYHLKFAFDDAEEDALVAACVIHARQGIPLTVQAFIRLASKLAGFEEGRYFSYKFARNFIKRKSLDLCMKPGKQTSPTRCLETMQQLTEKFVDLIQRYIGSGIMNKNNIVVFDETKVGDIPSLPLCIGESKDSAGRNINFVEIQEATLGCYIPFSMPNGDTPFGVFIFNNEKKKEACLLRLSSR